MIGVDRQDDLHGRFAGGDQLLRIGVIGIERLEVGLERLELVLAFFPAFRIAARQHGRNRDHMARIEVRHANLAFQGRAPQVVPALELDAGRHQVGAITDGIDIGPAADVIRADPGALDKMLVIRNLARIQLFKEIAVGVEPADVGSREGNVALGLGGKLRLVQAVDGAARDVLDRHAGLPREFLADAFIDEVAETAAPGAHHQGFLGPCRRTAKRGGERAKCQKLANRHYYPQSKR
ncbi:hypothetical protein D3C72_1226440 [compost metagenome]